MCTVTLYVHGLIQFPCHQLCNNQGWCHDFSDDQVDLAFNAGSMNKLSSFSNISVAYRL